MDLNQPQVAAAVVARARSLCWWACSGLADDRRERCCDGDRYRAEIEGRERTGTERQGVGRL